jgi:hypothetical protein
MKNHKPFISLPRHKRKDMVFRIKSDIKKEENIFGGGFSSYFMFDEDVPNFKAQWFRIFFLGLRQDIFWNVTIETAHCIFSEKVSSIAEDRINSMLTDEEYKNEFKTRLVPYEISATGEVLSFRLEERDCIRYKKFGGLTYAEKLLKLKNEIANEISPPIYEMFHHDYSCPYGIGLHIVVDVDGFDYEDIRQIITKFQAIDELDWQASQPVSVEKLRQKKIR